MTAISPNFTSETFGERPTLDQKILVFEDRELGWRFHIARDVEKIPHAGYVLISMVFAYFEMIAQYHSGASSNSGSRAAFRDGVRLVYPGFTRSDSDLNLIYERVRCGMYHNGYTKIGTVISGDFSEALHLRDGNVLVNPHKLLADLHAHLTSYIIALKDASNVELRQNFERIFDAGTR